MSQFIPTANARGWTSDVVNEISEQFIHYASSAQLPVLDIGAAYGVATLPALHKGCRIIANDLDPDVLNDLQMRTPPELRNRLTTVAAAFPDELSFPDESLAAVHASNVLHFLSPTQLETGLRKIFRWLQPGGKAFVVTGTPYENHLKLTIEPFLERKSAGEPFPGYFELGGPNIEPDLQTLLPSWLLLMDDELARSYFEDAGFIVEHCKMFRRRGLPERIWLDGRENLGIVASKPTD